MRHMANPASTGSKGGHVHLVQFDSSQKSLCGLLRIYTEFGGKTVQIAYETDAPVDCMACMKATEMVIRSQLRLMSYSGLSKLIDTIQGFTNGDFR